MKCNRCGGFMFKDEFHQWGKVYTYYRCALCGELVDPIIIQNRMEAVKDEKPEKKARPRFNWT